jgi:rSAM/selenodomain-associated transferase 2
MPAIPPLRVSIVVPTLDEEDALDATLAAAAAADEIVITDGGSRDRTLEVARRRGAAVVVGEAGRGAQLHRGAAAASGDVFLFLHADTLLPPGAIAAARAAIAGGAAGGAFEVRFDVDTPLYRFGARIANLRSRWTRLGLGDQAQFASRAVFDRMGGFRPWPILEDLDFARRLKRQGRVVIADQKVLTSARRFTSRGPARTVALNWLLWTLFACGVPPHRLAALYRHAR